MRKLMAIALVASGCVPALCVACACGCGVFSVGTSSLFPSGSGTTVFLEDDYMNQDRNWNGTSSAPLSLNDDKNIRTDFYSVGIQHMFNRDWGLMVQVPYWDRLFKTTLDDGSIGAFHHSALGDVRVLGSYTGFSGDMSTGVLFGVKLANGDYTYPDFDRDTAIGTGSTDIILGAYHEGGINADATWNGFAQAQWEHAVTTRGDYKPGNELDAAAGVYYNGWSFSMSSQLAPVLQLILSDRASDSGSEADPENSGYKRLIAAPGVEYDTGNFKFYFDVEVPVYQNTTGNQLVASQAYKFIIAYRF